MTTRSLNPARPLNLVRRLDLDDCQAVADLETQLFAGRFTPQSLRDMLKKPAFYGAVLPAVGQVEGPVVGLPEKDVFNSSNHSTIEEGSNIEAFQILINFILQYDIYILLS